MTATRDPDRILLAWLDLMPDELPDRSYAAVLDEIDHTPQVRRARLAGQWRFPVMPRLILAGAAVALAVVVGAIALVPRSSSGVAGSPLPTAVPSTSAAAASGAAAAVPPDLRHRWMGGTNTLVAPGAGSSITFGATSLALAQSNSNESVSLTADASAVGPGRLRLTTAGRSGHCDAGSAGIYDWLLSPSGRILNLVAIDDPCADRSGAVAGTWWLVGCKDSNDNCLGSLDAATYASQFINFDQGGTSWRPVFGALTYAVPNGWANDADWPTRVGLSPQAAFDQWTQEGGTPSGIDVLADVSAVSADKPCASTPAAGVARTPSAIVDTIRGIPGLVLSSETSITIDGREGRQVDLAVDDATLRPCASGERVVEYLYAGGEGQAMAPGERVRLIVLAGTPTPLAVAIIAPAADFDDLVPTAVRIAKTMQFK